MRCRCVKWRRKALMGSDEALKDIEEALKDNEEPLCG